MTGSLLDLVGETQPEKPTGVEPAQGGSLLDLVADPAQSAEQPAGEPFVDQAIDLGKETLGTVGNLIPDVETIKDTAGTALDTATEAGKSLLDYAGEVKDEYMPWLGGTQAMPAQVTQAPTNNPDALTKIGEGVKAGAELYPTTLKQRSAGAVSALGADDNVYSVPEFVARNLEGIGDPGKSSLERALQLMSINTPKLAGQFILDKTDEARAAVLDKINYRRVKPGSEEKIGKDNETLVKEVENISLKEVFKEYGGNLSKIADEEMKAGLPEDMGIPGQAGFSASTSVIDMAIGGGMLKLGKLLNAGTISAEMSANAWMQMYDEKLKATGDPKRATSYATFGAVAEGLGEVPGMINLFRIGRGGEFSKYIAKFIGYDIGGEIGTELAQLAKDIETSDEGQKNTLGENLDIWMDKAPETIAVTSLAAGMGAGAISTGVGLTVKAAQSYEEYKQQQVLAGIEKRGRIRAVEQASLVKAKIKLDKDMDAMTKKWLQESGTMEDFRKRLEALGQAIDVVQLDAPFKDLEGYNTIGANSYHAGKSVTELKGLTVTDSSGLAVPYAERNHGMDTEPQVFFGTNTGKWSVKSEIKRHKASIQNYTKNRDQAKANLDTTAYQQYQELIDTYSMKLENLQKRDYISGFLATEGTNFVRELQQTYMPGLSLLVHDNTVVEHGKKDENKISNTNGHMSIAMDGTVSLMVNPNQFTGEVELNPDGTLKQLQKSNIVETLTHEFGHAMAYHLYNKAPQEVQLAIKKAYESYRQQAEKLYNDPKATAKDLNRMGRGWGTTRRLRPKGYQGKYSAKQMMDLEKMGTSSGYPSFFHYVHSFDEWFAHEMERAYLGTSQINKIARNHFMRNAAVLKSMHNKAKNIYNPSEIFETALSYWKKDAEQSVEQELKDLLNTKQEQVEKDNLTGIESIDNVVDAVENYTADFELSDVTNPKSGLDRFNKFVANVETLTQIANDNKHIPELQKYVQAVEMWWAEKSKWNEKAIGTVEAWQGLSKDMADRVSKFALAVTLESDNLGRMLTLDELNDLNQQKKHRLSEDAMAIWEQVDQDFRDALGYDQANPKALYKALLEDVKRVHAANPEAALEAVVKLNTEMAEMANKNFFPLSRFGRYKVSIRATNDMVLEGKAYQKGDLISFETFEDIPTQKKAQEEYMRMLAGKPVSIKPGELKDMQFAYAGLPPNLIKAMQGELGLTADQRELLDDLILKQTSAAKFKRHLLERSGVPGFSQDAMRGYASYMANFANAVARMQYAPLLQEQITSFENTIEAVSDPNRNPGKRGREIVDEANRRAKMVAYLTEHFEYVMNPGNELANLRSVAFLFYLGLMPASAAVNLTQIPMVTLPYLSERKELGGSWKSTGTKAMYELTKATKDIMNLFKGKETRFTQQENEMFKELVNRGILDESQAQELAGLSEGSNLQRMLPDKWGFGQFKTRKAAGVIRNASHAGAFLFHHAEKFNRRLTALAAFRMAQQQGLDTKGAIDEAHRAVRETQFEYARWNRPKMMRGKKSVIFMFKMYLENILYFMAKGDGGKRAILLFFLVNGLQGGPGSEDMMDIYDFLSNKWNKFFGKKGARVAIREDLREITTNLGLDPNMVMHGIGSKYGLGLGHMLEFAGVPIPNVDISSRTSLGRVIPGLGPMLTDDQETAGRATAEAAGAVVNIPMGIYRALSSDNPDTWKNLEKGMPAAMRYWSQASRFLVRGEETRYNGSTLMPFNISDPLDATTVGLHAMGFQNTELARGKERDWALHQQEMFFRTRKSQITKQFATAVLAKDREGIADATKARKNYNDSVPHPSLKITATGQGQAIQKLAKDRRMSELGLSSKRKMVPATRSLLELYPIEEEGVK